MGNIWFRVQGKSLWGDMVWHLGLRVVGICGGCMGTPGVRGIMEKKMEATLQGSGFGVRDIIPPHEWKIKWERTWKMTWKLWVYRILKGFWVRLVTFGFGS